MVLWYNRQVSLWHVHMSLSLERHFYQVYIHLKHTRYGFLSTWCGWVEVVSTMTREHTGDSLSRLSFFFLYIHALACILRLYACLCVWIFMMFLSISERTTSSRMAILFSSSSMSPMPERNEWRRLPECLSLFFFAFLFVVVHPYPIFLYRTEASDSSSFLSFLVCLASPSLLPCAVTCANPHLKQTCFLLSFLSSVLFVFLSIREKPSSKEDLYFFL